MSTSHSRMLLATAALAGVLGLAACAAGPGSSPAPTSSASSTGDISGAAPPEGRVIGTGTVLDVAGDAQLCLGAVAESYPPQCTGIPLDGWTWEGVDGSETSGDTQWGTYAVYGTFDGDRYTVTDPPIMLALYDPIRPEDPAGGVDGTSSEADLARIQDEIAASLGREALSLWIERGYVWVNVVWDDGTLQDALDAEYGDDVVIVTSALREID
ncbi:hypothetical protein ACTJKH_16800 [Microbacterium sp. 22215]|uniref:hypothetical protein n=1 Tax=Microbacterium sp. 22215 TaxID=3453893 RepID=UPI003F8495EC